MVDVRTGCPDARLEPPEDNSHIIGECCMCGHEIRGWEKHFILYGDFLCDDSSCGQAYLQQFRVLA